MLLLLLLLVVIVLEVSTYALYVISGNKVNNGTNIRPNQNVGHRNKF